MKKQLYRLRSFFGFSKKETNGFLVLLFLILFLLTTPILVDVLYNPQTSIGIEDRRKLDSLATLLSAPAVATANQVAEKEIPDGKIYFNPNTATEAQLKKVIGGKLAGTIVRFREKGGRFFVKKDLMKVYGMKESIYENIEPFILLPEQILLKGKENKNLHSAASLSMDLNTADSLALDALPGIGKVLSARIIKYRTKLGGFIKLEQLYEVYGMDSLVIAQLRGRLYISNDFTPSQININAASEKELSAHPYIGKKLSKIIINYRNQHSTFTSLEIVHELPSIAPTDFIRMKPYLTVK